MVFIKPPEVKLLAGEQKATEKFHSFRLTVFQGHRRWSLLLRGAACLSCRTAEADFWAAVARGLERALDVGRGAQNGGRCGRGLWIQSGFLAGLWLITPRVSNHFCDTWESLLYMGGWSLGGHLGSIQSYQYWARRAKVDWVLRRTNPSSSVGPS